MNIITILAAVVFTANATDFRWSPQYPDSARNLTDSSIVSGMASAPQSVREACGWYALADNPPETASNEVAVVTGYVRTADGYARSYAVVAASAPTVRYSTLSICRELRSRGKWETVKGLLTQGGVWDDYYLANYLASNDPVFASACQAIVGAGILTQAELDELLPKCVWSAD